jgi:hypothetical protein
MLPISDVGSTKGCAMRRLTLILSALLAICFWPVSDLYAGDLEYPQVIRTRYEAPDAKVGGQFVIWSEREKIFYGLDPRLYPAARFVDITQVTPMAGSITLTYVEIRTVVGQTSDYLYLTGNVRFRVSGMVLKASNFPAGSMQP